MKKIALIFAALILFSFGVNIVSANVPTITDLEVATSTDGRTITITVIHTGPSSVHYVSKLEVMVGEDMIVVELDPQTATTFTEEVDVASSGAVQVRAYCTLHGWSAWAILGADVSNTPNEQPNSGIPGFGLVSVALGVAALVLLRRRL